jgi:hypothetical protein
MRVEYHLDFRADLFGLDSKIPFFSVLVHIAKNGYKYYISKISNIDIY